VTSSRRWVADARAARRARAVVRGAGEALFALRPSAGGGIQVCAIPKLEVWRAETGEALLHPNDEHIIALASDKEVDSTLPRFDLNDDAAIAGFVLEYLRFG